MLKKLCCAMVVLLAASAAAHSAEPGTTPVPPPVIALKGCWEGSGEVMNKPVTISIFAKPIVQEAMLALDVQSSAVSDVKDRYSAHLIFGGANKQPGKTEDQIVGFWADSFGGGFAALGQGEISSEGFNVTYQYPDDAYVNRWRLSGNHLMWQIVARDENNDEKPFASYSLQRVACRLR
ncbi:hypothetical protein [Novosphingobium soli]|uniref:DUF1579 domain-containing protein n=1 Tax=Novosphingobium soli TaxID=574956 RepID=A0ABV6CPP0_9SPHN